MIYHKITSCCIFYQTTFWLYTLVCVIRGKLGGKGRITHPRMDLRQKRKCNSMTTLMVGGWSFFILVENKDPSNLHTFKLQSPKYILWVNLWSSYGKKILTLNILWSDQPCHVLRFNLERCRAQIPTCEEVYNWLWMLWWDFLTIGLHHKNVINNWP